MAQKTKSPPSDLAACAREHARRLASEPYVPASAYRLQFNSQFTFARAGELLDYFEALGVDALYCSPYFQAAPGSMHGYDIVDPTRLNGEIGSRAEYEAFCGTLRARRLGHILDIVPNHMGVSQNANVWWEDVLENGAASRYAFVFDIDWDPVKPELKNRVLLPILGDLYGKILESGELTLRYENGALFVRYWENQFPADPRTYPAVFLPRLDALRAALGASPLVAQVENALAALGRLPDRAATDPALVEKRRRDKEPAKNRLRELAAGSPEVMKWLTQSAELLSGTPGQSRSFEPLHEFLESQSYRFSYWQAASDEINYRRFFDINALAAIRMEDEEVFNLHHRLLFELVRDGHVQGLRIDHPDGLYDPAGYFTRLQKACLRERIVRALGDDGLATREAAAAAAAEALGQRERHSVPFYVVAEKILDRKEDLPRDWSLCGTVGYGALNVLNGLFVDGAKETEFDKAYTDYIGHTIDYERLIYDKKKFFALVNMASETSTLAHRLDRISEHDRTWRDLTHNHLALALREVLACFPVYRTYISPGGEAVSPNDQRYIRTALGRARDKLPALHSSVFEFLTRVLLVMPADAPDSELARLYRDFTLRFQQISGPIMAKGVEDTAFYVFNRLLSLNEVGGDPTRFGWSRTDFHGYFQKRSEDWPAAMVETSTHDTKRSEDVRMRLNVLSEIPLEWQARLGEWGELNAVHKTLLGDSLEPRRNTEYFVYQTLLGVWPNESLDAAGRSTLLGRIWDAVLKSSREAKIYTNWSHPDADYEESLRKFVGGVVTSDKFRASFLPFQEKIAFYGMLNALSALTLKLAAPGVPDTYQGNELWDYSLVDPDNRRRVDFDLRLRLLRSLETAEAGAGPTAPMAQELLAKWQDGRVKMHILRAGLLLRRREKDLFLKGDYRPLSVEGPRQRHVAAFLRGFGPRRVLAAGGRLFTGVFSDRSMTASAWAKTVIVLPNEPECAGPWRNVFTGETVLPVQDGTRRVLEVPAVFGVLSAALLVNDLN